MKKHKWTDEEALFIKNYYYDKPDVWMADKLGVPLLEYDRFVNTLNIGRKGEDWTELEDKYLREHYGVDSTASIAVYLHRTLGSVYVRVQRIGIAKKNKK